jgi:hypothetical protein
VGAELQRCQLKRMKSFFDKHEPYLSTIGLLFFISTTSLFSTVHVPQTLPQVLTMLTPLGLLNSFLIQKNDWLVPYYFQATPEPFEVIPCLGIFLLWMRFYFYFKKVKTSL